MIKSKLGRKEFIFSLHFCIAVHHQSQDRNSNRAGSWWQDLMLRPRRVLLTVLLLLACSAYFLIELRTTRWGMAPPTMSWALLYYWSLVFSKCLSAGCHGGISSTEAPSSLTTLPFVKLTHKTSQYKYPPTSSLTICFLSIFFFFLSYHFVNSSLLGVTWTRAGFWQLERAAPVLSPAKVEVWHVWKAMLSAKWQTLLVSRATPFLTVWGAWNTHTLNLQNAVYLWWDYRFSLFSPNKKPTQQTFEIPKMPTHANEASQYVSLQPMIFAYFAYSYPRPPNYITLDSPQIKLICLPEADPRMLIFPFLFTSRLKLLSSLCSCGPVVIDPREKGDRPTLLSFRWSQD
jgi:hypothetical protein